MKNDLSYKQNPAFQLLLVEMIENILSHADNPGECGQYITNQIRDLIGVRIVAILQCMGSDKEHQHKLVSVCPAKRIELISKPEIEKLAALSHDIESSEIWKPGSELEKGGGLLSDLGFNDSVMVPLKFANTRVGVLILLDLMDSKGIDSIVKTLDGLSGIIALVLKNSTMYQELEIKVQERTQELSEKNKALIREINERKEAEEKIHNALKEKDILLNEIHHRVKNNLQACSSLIELQYYDIQDEKSLQLMKETECRIKSMAFIHEMLYQTKDFAKIDFGLYIRQLINQLISSYGINSEEIAISITVGNIYFGIDTAIPCGLLINELMSNAFKHAFPNNRQGEIKISLQQHHEIFELIISDNGIGLADDFDIGKSRSMGMILIKGWIRQLLAQLDISNQNGTKMKIRFKELIYKKN